MRITILVFLALVGATFAAFAVPMSSACSPDFSTGGAVTVDVYDTSCIGVVVTLRNSDCAINPIERGPIHLYPLADSPCKVGALIT
jgi:hypothetical protein